MSLPLARSLGATSNCNNAGARRPPSALIKLVAGARWAPFAAAAAATVILASDVVEVSWRPLPLVRVVLLLLLLLTRICSTLFCLLVNLDTTTTTSKTIQRARTNWCIFLLLLGRTPTKQTNDNETTDSKWQEEEIERKWEPIIGLSQLVAGWPT